MRWDWSAARAHCLRIARRTARSGSDAEEIAQEAVLRAWRAHARCRTPEAPWSWLAQITRREAARYYGRTGEEPVGSEPVGADTLAADALEAAMLRADVQRALADLDVDARRLLALRYEADLKQSTIADRLGIPEGTVKVRLHRAREQIRAMLD